MFSEGYKFFNNKLKEEWWYEIIKEEDFYKFWIKIKLVV